MASEVLFAVAQSRLPINCRSRELNTFTIRFLHEPLEILAPRVKVAAATLAKIPTRFLGWDHRADAIEQIPIPFPIPRNSRAFANSAICLGNVHEKCVPHPEEPHCGKSRCSRLVYWECALHVGGSMSKWESEWEWALGMDRPGGPRRLREALLLLLLPTMDNG